MSLPARTILSIVIRMLNSCVDLDSLTSSLLYAYIRSTTPTPNAFTPLYIPITNIPAADVDIRPEFLKVLSHANLESHHLITLDDLPDLSSIESQLPPHNTKWILVDHNALQGTLGSIYSERVQGVIDHHEDEGKVPTDTGDEPRIITKAGSCTSLVTEYCSSAWDGLSSSAQSSGAAHGQDDASGVVDDSAVSALWDAQIAKLALASILVDTANLQSKEKVTDHDVYAAKYLEAKLTAAPQVSKDFDRAKFYKEINAAKKDIGSLPLRDILRKDYKQWMEGKRNLGVSSVVKPIEFLQEKAKEELQDKSKQEAFLAAVEHFAQERNLQIYGIMTTSTSANGDFQRELLVWSFTPEATQAAKKFSQIAAQELGLEDWQGSGGSLDDVEGEKQWRKVWRQREVQHSRKRVAPLLRQAMS
ncbi:Exopolyphosphatase [Coniosporium apollinis]|uniref:Exopolyphosphatase n=1 Tax=Coniosporium apollinis TaxID=61459 RepID=A0ABQ9NQW9_9PEZI|nr:Exopolyphosphatase [Coniosporium apollinis]